ncbi:hypothetical protein [Pedobacter ureilyticus]|uniref:Uncharacterized protein n=1 Tax=Pedobacter ureilyticus TaxID=1393051 RepID=A0ABW9J456_9SPHI|nr:hypothetical protein [Pedobacter helvus]
MGKKQILIRVYLFVSALITLDVVLYCFWQMSFTGYWSDRVIFWIWLLLTPVVTFSFWKKLWAKIYFGLLVVGLILSILPMAIPFFGILLSGSGSGRLNHFNLENNIRIQTVGYGVMGRPRVQIVKDGLLFDKIKFEDGDEIGANDVISIKPEDAKNGEEQELPAFAIRDAKNIKLIKEADTCISVKCFFEKATVETIYRFKEKKSFNY